MAPRGLPIVLLVGLLAACQSGAERGAVPADPAVYAQARDPEGQAAWGRAQAALARGDASAALPDLQLAATRCPDLVRAHLAFQDAARQVGGEWPSTMQAFYRALPERDSPVPAYVKARLAETSYAQGTELQRILARHPGFAWAHLSLGRLRYRQGQLPAAADSFQAAIAQDSDLFEARLEHAQVLAELGRDEEAARDYEAYLARAPKDDAAMRAFVSLLIYKVGNINRARQLLDRLEAAHPDDDAVRMDRAAAQWRGGDPRAAIDSYLAVLEKRPEEARAAFNIGLLYYEVLPQNEAERRLFWPRARAAFRLFQNSGAAGRDGHETFERTIAVPYRLQVIDDLLGASAQTTFTIADLRLPLGR